MVLSLAACDPFELANPHQHPRQSGQYSPQRGPQHAPQGNSWDQGGYDQQTPGPPRDPNTPVPQRYPMAQRTEIPNQVISPYAPFNVIDITGFNSGQLARDPTNNEIFRIP